MPSIVVHSDPSGACKREIFPVRVGCMVSEWIMTQWPDGIEIPTGVYLGTVAPENLLFKLPLVMVGDSPHDHMLGPDDVIHIVRTPLEPATIILAVVAVVSVASSFLLRPNIPIPETPEFEQAQESPNNRLSGQTNVARPLQRIPDLYGKNRVYPDLIFKSYSEFINHTKFVTEYLCIGRGEYLIENIKSGDNLISDIDGSTATIFDPFTRPTSLFDVTLSTTVDGQELAAPNDAATLSIDNLNITAMTGVLLTAVDQKMTPFGNLTQGDTFTIANSTSNNGTFTFVEFTFESAEGEPTFYTVEVQETFTTQGTDTIDISSTSGKSSEFGPFRVPGDDSVDEIWIDIIAPKGLQLIDGTAKTPVTVDFTATIQELDSGGSPVGAPQLESISIQDNTLDGRFYTFKLEPTNPGNRHEISLERLTNTVNDSTKQIFDLTKWSAMSGVDILTTGELSDFGNVTTALINTRATEQATQAQQRRFNVVATRKLRTYDTGTQSIVPALAATAKVADAALQHLTDPFIGNRAVTDLDLDELYEIQDRLDTDAIYGDKLGRFSYSFSNDKTPVDDELKTILNGARMLFYREGSKFRFVRDEIRANRVALFNSRTKKPGGESKVVKFFKPGDNDGIELRWVDETTGEAATIFLPDPIGGSNNLRVDAAGIKNFEQAWNRATYEFAKLKLSRINVSTTVGIDGILPRINDRVANVDGTNISAQGGEVIAFSGLTLETDAEIDFGASPTGTVILSGPNGTPSDPLDCIPRLDGVNGLILTESPTFGIFIRDENIQVGSKYSFFAGPDDDHNVNDYLIAKIDPKDGEVKLIMVEYKPEIYDADTTTPPAP